MKNLDFLSKNWAVFLIFAAIGLALYANSLANPFFWDDNDFFVNNIFVREFDVGKFFSQNVIAGSGNISNYWRPLLLLSFAIDYKIWGFWPIGFHLSNILLHIADAFLLFLVLKALFKNKVVSFFPALIFLIHPLQTETVTYVNSRGDSLYVFWILLGILAYLKWRCGGGKKFYAAGLIVYALGLMSKESAIVLPAILIIIELIFLSDEKPWRFKIIYALKRTFFFWLTAAGYFISRVTILNFSSSLNFLHDIDTPFSASLFVRLLTFLKVVLIYLGLIFAPITLRMERGAEAVTTVLNPWTIGGIVLILLWIATSCKLKASAIGESASGGKSYWFGFFWFFINLAPTANIFPLNAQLYEHWLYLAQVGVWIVVCDFLRRAYSKFEKLNRRKLRRFLKIALIALITIYLIALSYRTILRNRDWGDPVDFYRQVLGYSESARVYNNLGLELAENGRLEEAIANYRRALELYGDFPQAHYNIANSLRDLGRDREAVKEYEAAIAADPYFVLAYNNLANILNKQKDYATLKNLTEKLLALIPDYTRAQGQLGWAYYSLGEYKKAIEIWEKYLSQQPNDEYIRNLKNDAASRTR